MMWAFAHAQGASDCMLTGLATCLLPLLEWEFEPQAGLEVFCFGPQHFLELVFKDFLWVFQVFSLLSSFDPLARSAVFCFSLSDLSLSLSLSLSLGRNTNSGGLIVLVSK